MSVGNRSLMMEEAVDIIQFRDKWEEGEKRIVIGPVTQWVSQEKVAKPG